MGESGTLAREREHGEVRVDSTEKEGRFQGGKGGHVGRASSRRSRRKHERVSGRKSSPGRSAESWLSLLVWPNLNWERRFRDEGLAHKTKE